MSNGVVNTHAIPLGIVGSTLVKTALDHYIAYLEKSGVARWRDKIPSSVFVSSNPNVMYNGSYVVSMSIRTDTENPSGELFSDPEDIVSEAQPVRWEPAAAPVAAEDNFRKSRRFGPFFFMTESMLAGSALPRFRLGNGTDRYRACSGHRVTDLR